MSEVHTLFKNLSKYFHALLTWEDIEKIYENSTDDDEESNDESDASDVDSGCSDSDNETLGQLRNKSKIKSVEKIPMVKKAIKDPMVLSNLMDLSSAIRNLRESTTGYDNTYDCWDQTIKVASRDKYLAFVYSLLRLAQYKPKNKIYRKLSIITARTYFLSLTIPGAKGFHIFDEKIIEKAIGVFNLIKLLQNKEISFTISKNENVEIWINFMNFCDDLKLMFRYVYFDKYQDTRNTILWELCKLLHNNHINGFTNLYSANLHSKCFEIFEEVINAHNGEPEQTLKKIMQICFLMHFQPPMAKRCESFSTNSDFTEHISDWFIKSIQKYPRILPNVLTNYIKFVLVNQDKSWRPEQFQRALDYAAKYDAALYSNCNESIMPVLSETLMADEPNIRQNSIELCNRIILIDSKVNWEMFRNEVSNIPRELYLIEKLIMHLSDVNNGVKLKALHGLHQAFQKGTSDAKKILIEGITYATFENDTEIELPEEPRKQSYEIRYSKPSPIEANYTFEGHEIIQPYFNKLPKLIYFLLNNPVGYVRKAAITLLEVMVNINPLIIYNTNFVKQCSALAQDPNALVRKQSLQMIDSILGQYPNCYPTIWTWCKIIVPLFEETDAKNVELAWECFKRRVFDNIRGIDQSNQAEHFMPWVIIRVLLLMQPRQFLANCIKEAIKKNSLDTKVIVMIESHTLTSNSILAWILLSFISGKIKCREPDSLITAFNKSIADQTWNSEQNLLIITDIISESIKIFSHSALNMAFSCIVIKLKEGIMPPTLVGKTFDLCINIYTESNKKALQSTENPKWIKEIHTECEHYLLDNLSNIYANKAKFMSYLYTYSETNLELHIRPQEKIINFLYGAIKAFLNIGESALDREDVDTLNSMIIISARFSIRDPTIASTTCVLFGLVLKRMDRPPIINTVVVAVTDLCKRHTQTVELVLKNVLDKLNSQYLENRIETFKNLSILIMQDQIKLRGNILLALMTSMLDENVQLSNSAIEFFKEYLETKNSLLFQTCLLECPFVYNDYMHFDAFESFSGIEVESPLKGENNRDKRQLLYNHFLHEIDEINQLMYFDNLKFIHGKIQKASTIKSPEGYAMIMDVFYILKNICDRFSRKKENKPQQEGNDDLNDINLNEIENNKTAAPETSKKGKRNAPTLNDAMEIVEKAISLLPKISIVLLKWDQCFERSIDELCTEISNKFENFTEFAQPANFWNKYRPKVKPVTNTKKKKQVTHTKETSDEDSESSDDIILNTLLN